MLDKWILKVTNTNSKTHLISILFKLETAFPLVLLSWLPNLKLPLFDLNTGDNRFWCVVLWGKDGERFIIKQNNELTKTENNCWTQKRLFANTNLMSIENINLVNFFNDNYFPDILCKIMLMFCVEKTKWNSTSCKIYNTNSNFALGCQL